MAKRNSFEWTVSHGRGVSVRAPVWTCIGVTGKRVYDMGKLSDTMFQTLVESAATRSKLHDAMALPAGTSESVRFAAMDAVYETLVAGEWNAKRETLSPEQRAEILAERVGAAWVSLDAENRSGDMFAEMVERRVGELRKLGNSSVTRDTIIAALSKNAKIIAAIAAMVGNANEELIADLV